MSQSDECMDILISQLYEVLNKNNWSARVASDFMGIGRNVFSNIVNRKTGVSLKTLCTIADSLDRPVASLICKEGLQSWKNEQLLRQMQADMDKLIKKGGVV